MAHMWAKFKRGVHATAKVAAGIGAVALAVHGIHKSHELHNQVNFSSHASAPSLSDQHFAMMRDYRAAQTARNPNWRNTP